MSQFKENLQKNNFVCSFCQKCDKLVWPPSDYCSSCFGQTMWRPLNRTAKLIEIVKKNNDCICLVEFESGIRIMGILHKGENSKPGDVLNLVKCNYSNTEEFILEPIS